MTRKRRKRHSRGKPLKASVFTEVKKLCKGINVLTTAIGKRLNEEKKVDF